MGPALPILVEQFCNLMWKALINPEGRASITDAQIDDFFKNHHDGNGQIERASLESLLETHLGGGSAKIMTSQMLSVAAGEQESEAVTRNALSSFLHVPIELVRSLSGLVSPRRRRPNRLVTIASSQSPRSTDFSRITSNMSRATSRLSSTDSPSSSGMKS